MGTVLYYLLWPLVWFYAPLTTRVRVIICAGDEVLVVKNWFGPDAWQLPGGGIKFGEKPLDTAKREIKEELAINLAEDSIRLLNDEAVIVRKHGLLSRFIYAEVLLKQMPAVELGHGVTKYKWMPVSEISLHPDVSSLIRQG